MGGRPPSAVWQRVGSATIRIPSHSLRVSALVPFWDSSLSGIGMRQALARLLRRDQNQRARAFAPARQRTHDLEECRPTEAGMAARCLDSDHRLACCCRNYAASTAHARIRNTSYGPRQQSPNRAPSDLRPVLERAALGHRAAARGAGLSRRACRPVHGRHGHGCQVWHADCGPACSQPIASCPPRASRTAPVM